MANPKYCTFLLAQKKYNPKMGQTKHSFRGDAGSLLGDPAGTSDMLLLTNQNEL
jgi:hypothetical protein